MDASAADLLTLVPQRVPAAALSLLRTARAGRVEAESESDPGTRYIWGRRWHYTVDSATPQWRAIRDDKGRIIVAICHNSDVGDAWEWADSADYPEHPASVAYRLGVNYIIYAMTH